MTVLPFICSCVFTLALCIVALDQLSNILRRATKVAGYSKGKEDQVSDAALAPVLDIDYTDEWDDAGTSSAERREGDSRPAPRLVVVGGGYTGYEIEELSVKVETDRFLATVESFWPESAPLSRRMILGKIAAERKRKGSSIKSKSSASAHQKAQTSVSNGASINSSSNSSGGGSSSSSSSSSSSNKSQSKKKASSNSVNGKAPDAFSSVTAATAAAKTTIVGSPGAISTVPSSSHAMPRKGKLFKRMVVKPTLPLVPGQPISVPDFDPIMIIEGNLPKTQPMETDDNDVDRTFAEA